MKKNKINEIFRSYELLHKANQAKLDILFHLYKTYTKEYKQFTLNYWSLFKNNKINNNRFSHLGSTKNISTQLNASYLQVCLSQACASLNNYLANIEEKFNHFLNQSSIHDKDKLHQLRTINSNHAWLNKEVFYYPVYEYNIVDDFGNLIKTITVKLHINISQENLKLSKKIFKHIIEKQRVKFPNLNKPRLLIDDRLYSLEKSKAKNGKQSTFDYWLNISTLQRGKRIAIPIKSNDFFNQADGILGKTIELNFNHLDYEKTIHHYQSLNKSKINKSKLNKSLKKQGLIKVNRKLKIIFNKKHTLEEYSNKILKNNLLNNKSINNSIKDKIIAIDLGLCNLIAISEGQLKGRYWLDKLKQYDKQITELSAYRQSRGLKTRSKRYDNLIQRVRGFIKSHINFILNNYFNQNQDIKTVLIEKLHFNHPDLSKKLNRMIKNFGLSIFKSKLSDLSLIYGFEIKELNSAYTSQECTNCGYIDRNNRTTQSRFKCLCCGKELHADVQSSRNLVKRFHSNISANNSLHKSTILRQLKLDFIKNIKALLSNGIIGRRKLFNLLSKNIYFRDEIKFVCTTEVSGLEPMTVDNFDLLLI